MTAVATSGATRSARALLVADEACRGATVRALSDAVDLHSSVVHLAIMCRVPRWIRWLGPMSGLTSGAQLIEEAEVRADRAAGWIADELRGARVERRVVRSWCDVISLIERSHFDVVIVGRQPTLRTHVRRLVDASARGKSALVLVDRDRAL